MIQLIIGAGLGLGGVAAAVAIKRYNEAEREKAAGPADHWGNRYEARIVSPACALPLILAGAVIAASACLYTQDTGEVCVIRNLGGSLAGSTSEAGFHAKAPWQDVVTYDVRNNLINFYGDTDYEVDGGSYEGKQVSINDKSGASANIDIQVNYSLNPDAALSLYSEYGTQESFVEKYISNDVRAVTREVSGGFDTVTMLTDRSQFTKAVQKALTKKWKGIGLTVEQVSVQDVRYPKNITKSYSEAQAAEVAKQKAQNEQETAKVQAETKKIEAQGEADANAVLANSLNDPVIQQHYIDAPQSIGTDGHLALGPEAPRRWSAPRRGRLPRAGRPRGGTVAPRLSITIRGDVPYRCRAGGEAPESKQQKRSRPVWKAGTAPDLKGGHSWILAEPKRSSRWPTSLASDTS